MNISEKDWWRFSVAALVLLLLATLVQGCTDVTKSLKVWEEGCHVIVKGIVSAGAIGVGGNLDVYKECWPTGQTPVVPN